MVDGNRPSKSLLIEDAKLIFRNFSGLEREFNSAGDRNFSVILEPELAKKLLDEGWRVKQLKPREPGEEGDYHLKVKVKYKTKEDEPRNPRDPKIMVKTSRNRVEWSQKEIGALDHAELEKVHLLINGWWSDMAGGGYGGFLKTAFITLYEDELEQRFGAELQDATAGLETSTDDSFVDSLQDDEDAA
jgi:hypothetical protein